MDKIGGGVVLFAAWLLALGASLIVLFMGEVLGQEPCWLCWVQRAFMFPLVVVLGLGLWWQDRAAGRYGLGLAASGLAFALWHLGLYVGLVPEPIRPCSATGPSCTGANQLILGVPIPLLSVITFLTIALLCALALKDRRS